MKPTLIQMITIMLIRNMNNGNISMGGKQYKDLVNCSPGIGV